MVFSHWARPRPRQMARPIKMAYIELYEGVHTALRQYHWCHWLRHLIGLVISLGVILCEHSITVDVNTNGTETNIHQSLPFIETFCPKNSSLLLSKKIRRPSWLWTSKQKTNINLSEASHNIVERLAISWLTGSTICYAHVSLVGLSGARGWPYGVSIVTHVFLIRLSRY